MRLFITGASGFLGKNFINLALRKKIKIYALSRKKKYSKKLIWLKGDLKIKWKKELKKSDILVHFATHGVNNNNVQSIYETNFFESVEFINNAVKSNCKKWLIISSSSEYGLRSRKMKKIKLNANRIPYSDYGMSKAMFVDYCKKIAIKSKSKCRVMRLFPFYGKFEPKNRLYTSLMQSIKKKRTFKIKNPSEVRSFSNVSYISKVLLEALDFEKNYFKSFQTWNVSEERTMSVKDFVFEIWKKKSTKKVIYAKKNLFYTHIPDKNSLWKLNEESGK